MLIADLESYGWGSEADSGGERSSVEPSTENNNSKRPSSKPQIQRLLVACKHHLNILLHHNTHSTYSCNVLLWIFSLFTSIQFTFSSLVFKRILIFGFSFYSVSRFNMCYNTYCYILLPSVFFGVNIFQALQSKARVVV